MEPRELIALLEDGAGTQDRLMLQLIDILKDREAAKAGIETLCRCQSFLQLARSAFIAEAVMALTEVEEGQTLHALFEARRQARSVQ